MEHDVTQRLKDSVGVREIEWTVFIVACLSWLKSSRLRVGSETICTVLTLRRCGFGLCSTIFLGFFMAKEADEMSLCRYISCRSPGVLYFGLKTD